MCELKIPLSEIILKLQENCADMGNSNRMPDADTSENIAEPLLLNREFVNWYKATPKRNIESTGGDLQIGVTFL